MIFFLTLISSVFLLLLLLWVISQLKWKNSYAGKRPKSWAKAIESEQLKNFYSISDNVYRSKQPSAEAMVELEKRGFKGILNLRHYKKDDYKASGTKLNLQHIPINTWTLSKRELMAAVKILKEAEKPILVHCLHGSDRTGAVIAAYRILEMGWSKKEAIMELKYGGFGYHQFYFPHILWQLNSLDKDSE